MKIIHIMMKEKFTDGIVAFLNQFFCNGEHEVLYFHPNGVNEDSLINKKYDICQRELYKNSKKDFVKYLEGLTCDYIILHSLFFVSTMDKIKLLGKRNLMNKLVWIEWGADLYSWKMSGGLKTKISNYINYVFRKTLRHVICIFPPDADYFRTIFRNSKAKLYYAPYTSYPRPKELMEDYSETSRLQKAIDNDETIYIQIGHNGMETLNHKRVLKSLYKFRDENIHVFLPLSYGGTKEYVDEIESCAKAMFPNKITVLRDFMPEEEYYELIKKVSIVIFDTGRQCALGNINLMIFRNVKVFLSETGVMYNYFVKRGIPVNKCEDINKLTYSEFIRPNTTYDKEKFDSYIYDISHIEPSVEKWTRIYTDLKDELELRKKSAR